ncbi:MAG: hypothetical protein IKE09_08405 [Clostridiales bacterium]|nr:hypothetical protein [Clostridiales bacterium]
MKKLLAIIMSATILLIAGCSSTHEPITTIPVNSETTVGDIAGTIEGDRYVSHAGGVVFKLTGDYTINWPDADKRDQLMNDYTGIEILGPWFVWGNTASMKIDYVLDEHMKEDATKKQTLEEWNKTINYPIESIEYIDEYKIDGKSCFALKMEIDKNGYDISSLQIYYFQDNGLLVLITVSAGSFKEIDKITKNIQLA